MKKLFTLLFTLSTISIFFSQTDANPSVDFTSNSSESNTNAVKKGNL